jgi:hypothetical protein
MPCKAAGCNKLVKPTVHALCKHSFCCACCRQKKQPCKYHSKTTYEEDVAALMQLTVPQRAAALRKVTERAGLAWARAEAAEAADDEVVDEPVARPRDGFIRSIVSAEGEVQLAQARLALCPSGDASAAVREDAKQLLRVAEEALASAQLLLGVEPEGTCPEDAMARRSVYGLQAATWPMLDDDGAKVGLLHKWRLKRAKVCNEIQCCGFCGEVELGGRHTRIRYLLVPAVPAGTMPPYAACNDIKPWSPSNQYRQCERPP